MKSKMSVIVAMVVVGAWALASAQAPSIQGAWRVSEIVVTGANASTNTTPQPGLYIFTKQHYSIVTVNGTAARKEVTAPKDPARLTDAEKIARYEMWNPVTAKSGTYEVKGTTLTTRPLAAKNVFAMAGPATREFKIDGKTLTLVSKSAAGQPVAQTTTKLTRVE
jgi:hypothetical protein